MQQREQTPDPDDEEREGHRTAFAACCTQCLCDLRQTRLAPREAGWRARLAWHRTRFGALLTADVELDRRIAAIGSDRRWFDRVDIRVASVDALMGLSKLPFSCRREPVKKGRAANQSDHG